MIFPSTTVPVTTLDLPGQQHWQDEVFPLALGCTDPTIGLERIVAWVGEQAAELTRLAALHGAVLFRDFPIDSIEAFDRFIAAFGYSNFPYAESLSNAVRVNFTPRVFTANEAPADVTIYLHHEMAQTPIFPSRLLFHCRAAPESGGATPLCRSDVLWDLINEELPAFAADCKNKGLRYTNVMPDSDDAGSGLGRSWQRTFTAKDRLEAEARLQELGYSWSWLDDGCLRATTPVLAAVRKASSGRTSFFNQLIAAFKGWKDSRNDPAKSVTFGDGSRLDPALVDTVAELADRCTVDLPWQTGDVALVDNIVAMHGRRPFTGTRQVLASLADACRI